MGVINLGILVEKIKRKLIGSGFVTNTDYASSSNAGVIKTNTSYGNNVNVNGVLIGAPLTLAEYGSGSTYLLVSKATLENIKADVTARSLVDIAAAQITTPVSGTYTVKLTYDGANWGVTIIQDT